MFKIAVCDDDVSFIELEKRIIQKVFETNQADVEIDEYYSGEALLALTKEQMEKYNLIFLDVDMERMNGIETAQRIREVSQVTIAFLTAFIDYSLEGYKVNAIRYVLKDINTMEDAISECVDAVMEQEKLHPTYTFSFREAEIKCELDHIVAAESRLHYVTVTIDKGEKCYEYSMRTTLDEFEKMLHHKNMIRIHRSILVNAAYIKRIKRYAVVLRNGTEYGISQSRYNDVKKYYAKYLGDV